MRRRRLPGALDGAPRALHGLNGRWRALVVVVVVVVDDVHDGGTALVVVLEIVLLVLRLLLIIVLLRLGSVRRRGAICRRVRALVVQHSG